MTCTIEPNLQMPQPSIQKPAETPVPGLSAAETRPSSPAGNKKSAPESGDTRERILRAALRIIGEHGVEAVSNRRLAREAGVALGSLTYHFPSQTELLRESLLLYVNEEVARLSAAAAMVRAADPTLEEVAGEVERIATDTQIGPEAIAELELHLQAARDPALQEASRRCFEAYDEVAVAALQVLGVPDAKVHARTVVALISGFSLRRIGTGEPDVSGLADALVALARGVGVSTDG